MDLRNLNLASSPLRLCCSACIGISPLFSPKHTARFSIRRFKTSLFSPSSHHSVERGDVSSCSTNNVGSIPHEKFLQVVLVSPQIPGNTGSIARTCAASAIGLHLIEPLGFQVDDTKLKRAGLDYWPYVVVKVHSSWANFRAYFKQQEGEKRLLAFTKRGMAVHSDFSYKRGDWLVFGSESSGLPPEALFDCNNETLGGGTIRIPMVETYVRCLNLAVSVGIAVYEASRQLSYEQLHCPPNVVGESEIGVVQTPLGIELEFVHSWSDSVDWLLSQWGQQGTGSR